MIFFLLAVAVYEIITVYNLSNNDYGGHSFTCGHLIQH